MSSSLGGIGRQLAAGIVVVFVCAVPVVASAQPAAASLDPTSHAFGSVQIGTTSAQRTFTISNTGMATLTVSAIDLTDTANFEFVNKPALPFDVAGGSSRTFNVRCAPETVGTKSGTVNVTTDTNDPSASLSCTAINPEITLVTAATLQFGNVLVGATSPAQALTIRNDGATNLVVSSFALGGTGAANFAASAPVVPPNITIAPGATQSWSITCSPNSLGLKAAQISIGSNDASENPLVVELRCTGVEPDLSVSPNPVAMGGVRVCETAAPRTVTFTNSGSSQLTINSITVSNSIFPVVTAPPALPTTLAVNGSISMQVGFIPTTGQVYSGSINVTSNDPDGPLGVPITGTGLLSGMALAPGASHDYGDVRTDQAGQPQQFTIRNSGQANFVVQTISLNDNTNFARSPVALPVTLRPPPAGPNGTGEVLTFTVTAQPQTLGTKTATATIQTDLPCGPIQTVNLTAQGVAPNLMLSAGALAFGGVDVQAGVPTFQMLSVTNTGSATLSLPDVFLEAPEGGPYTGGVYTIVNPGPVSVAPGTSSTVMVQYQPLVAGPEDRAVLVLSGDIRADIQLSGRGLDRVISAPTLLEFPPTYRNPATPTAVQLVIENLGTIDLDVSDLRFEGAGVNPSFRINGELAFSVGPGASRMVTVEFAPREISAEPLTAELVVINDDDERPMYRIGMRGRGILPEVAVTPGTVDFGTVGANVSATIPEGTPRVDVVNMNPDRAFTVSQLKIVDEETGESLDHVMRVVDWSGRVTLQPNQRMSFDIEFSPDRPGLYRGELEVYIDADGERLTGIVLQGRAIELRLRGGGCTAAAGGCEPAGVALAAVLLALAWAWRRRRAGMWLAALGIAAIAVSPASAEPTRNLDISNFRPIPSVDSEMIQVETTEVGDDRSWSVGAVLNHAVNPLRVESPDVPGTIDLPVRARTALEVIGSYALRGRFELGVGIPLVRQSGDAPSFSGIEPAEGAAIGDVAVHAKAWLVRMMPLAVSGSATLTLPTASDGEFAGTGGPTAHVRGIAGLTTRRVTVGANAGLRLRSTGELGDVAQGHELTYGLGGAMRVIDPMSAVAEIYGGFGLSGSGSGGMRGTAGTSPLEGLVGVRYRVTREWSVVGGLGRGLLPGIGSPDVRAFVSVAYAVGAREIEPIAVPIGERPGDRRDTDGDGILNYLDRCRTEAEDIDGVDDDDGCPDVDEDRDGVVDSADRCPSDAEDLDGFEDFDGCPDTDNDGDGVLDVNDACPDTPEDMDGFDDADGCVDPDNDVDGILDLVDGCPLQPETINGVTDDDGCPDRGKSAVAISGDTLELIQPLRFRGWSAALGRGSDKVLAQVGATLRARREVTRAVITVHVHPRGEKDMALSQERAEAIKKWLIDWGVEPERLEARGMGSNQPVSKGNSASARTANDRVELLLTTEKRGKRAR